MRHSILVGGKIFSHSAHVASTFSRSSSATRLMKVSLDGEKVAGSTPCILYMLHDQFISPLGSARSKYPTPLSRCDSAMLLSLLTSACFACCSAPTRRISHHVKALIIKIPMSAEAASTKLDSRQR